MVVVSIAVAIGIYLLPVKPLKVKEETKEEKEEKVASEDTFDAGTYFSGKKEALEVLLQDSLNLLDNQLESAAGAEEKLEHLEKITDFCYRNKLAALAAKYEKKKIEWSSDPDELKKTGDRLIRISFVEEQNPGARLYISNAAIKAYNKALEVDPDNIDTKVRVASAYMDGTNQVMQGVTLLLEVLDDDPENVDANLILGRYGIISGQLDKALSRLNTVIEQDSTIAEAYLYRAEALNGLGRTEEAIADFERCKKLLDNPQLEREIDIFIKELKNN